MSDTTSSGTDRPKTYHVFMEGVGFGLVSVAAFIHLWPNLWTIPLIVGSVLIMLTFGRNARSMSAGGER